MKKIQKGLMTLADITLWVIVIALFTYTLSNVITAAPHGFNMNKGHLLGYKLVPGRGGSMEPTFENKLNIMVVKMIDYDEIEQEDIINFDIPITNDNGKVVKHTVVHRVIDEEVNGLITKGDGNAHIDYWVVQEDHFNGRVDYIIKGWKLVSVKDLNVEGIRTEVDVNIDTKELN